MANETRGPTPRDGYKGRKGGDPYTPERATPRYTGSKPGKYPSVDKPAPREGYKAKLAKAGDPKTPDIPSPNVVEPIATRPTPRADTASVPK